MKEKNFLDLSWSSIFKIVVTLFFIFVVYKIQEILMLVIFSLIIFLLFEPAINFLEEKKIKRAISVPLLYFSFFLILGTLTFFFSAPIVGEFDKFAKRIPEHFEKISPFFQRLGIEAFESFESFTKSFQEWLIRASSSIFSAISAIFGGIFSTLTIFSFSFFLSLEGKEIEKLVALFLPKEKQEKVLKILKSCQEKVSFWFAIRLLGCFFVGLFTFFTLKVLNIEYSFSLSVLSGVLNLIPILGPIFAAAFVAIFVSINSFSKAIFFLVAFVLIQQIEGNFLTPLFTNKLIKMSPFLVLFSILVGAKLFGFWGSILAIPLGAIFLEFLKEFFGKES
mgnify:CR=1 FL=1